MATPGKRAAAKESEPAVQQDVLEFFGPGGSEEPELQELDPNDPAIDKELLPSFALAPASRGVLKKANEAIVMRPIRGDFVFLSRKIYNVLLYHAQQQGLAEKDTFSIPRSALCKDAGFESKDMQMLKERLLALMSATVEWGWVGDPEKAPNGRLWEATTLLSYAGFYRGSNTGEIWVRWSYSKELKQQLLESNQYTKLSLAIIARLRSLPALALYELASRYATSPSRVSKRATWEAWVTILRGKPIKEYPTLDYRRFKKETIIPARAQVNSEQKDFVVDFKEFKTGKRVTHLQLVVTPQHPARPNMDARASMDISLFNRMLSLGIGQYTADAIYGSCDEDVLREAIGAVESRIKNTKIPPVQNVEAYLKQRVKTLQEVIDADERNHPEWGELPLGEGGAAGNDEHESPREAQQGTVLERGQHEGGNEVPPQVGPPLPVDVPETDTEGGRLRSNPHRAEGKDEPPAHSEHIDALRVAYERKKTARARAMFHEAIDDQQKEWQRDFEREYLPNATRTFIETYAKKGVSAPLVRVPFFKWLADRTWTEKPSDLELFRWGVENRILRFRDE